MQVSEGKSYRSPFEGSFEGCRERLLLLPRAREVAGGSGPIRLGIHPGVALR